MSNEMVKLETERLRLIEMARGDARQRHIRDSVLTGAGVVAVGIVVLLLINAIWDEQVSIAGLFGAAVATAFLFFILSRTILKGAPKATVADLAFGLGPARSNDAIQTKIAEYEMEIARLKAGENK
jgi:hypothetical protein